MDDDPQILATIAYSRATWPLGLCVSQALLNPGYPAGRPMPTGGVAASGHLPGGAAARA